MINNAQRDPNGKLASFAWPGGYPLMYLTKDGLCVCPECANRDESDLVACEANWEDPELFCDDCSRRIESAYAD